jgi:Tfp pilus assembly protein FimT
MAARSDAAAANARCPISAADSWSRRKWMQSTIASTEVTA